MSADLFLQILVNALMSSLMLILIALGVTLVFGLMRIVNFYQGELYVLGGFVTWYFTSTVIPDLAGSKVLTFGLAVLLSGASVAILGMLIERLMLRRWHGKMFVSLIIALGLVPILQGGMFAVFGGLDKKAPDPFPGVVHLGGVTLQQSRVMAIVVAAVVVVAMYLFIRNTRIGRAMRAIEQDRDAAALQGVNYGRTCSWGMGIGCALSAIAGAVAAVVFSINPWSGATPLIKAFTVVILGGMGSFGGTVAAGFLIGFLESWAGTLLSADIALLLIYGTLITILIVRPKGLFGRE